MTVLDKPEHREVVAEAEIPQMLEALAQLTGIMVGQEN